MRKPLNTLVFCSDGATKQRFKECFQVGKFDVTLHVALTCGDLDDRLKEGEIDFILVALRAYDKRFELLREFAKRGEGTTPPALVLVYENEAKGTLLSGLLSEGADGVVLEPLRVEAVEEAVQHLLDSAKYKNFRSERARGILAITLSNACGLIDNHARHKLGLAAIDRDMTRDWPLTQARLTSMREACGEEAFIRSLMSACATREPFAARASRRSARKKLILHPAKIVTRIMTVRGISPEKLADAMRMDPSIVSTFLSEASDMTEELAENFGRVLGHDKEYWLSLSPTHAKQVAQN